MGGILGNIILKKYDVSNTDTPGTGVNDVILNRNDIFVYFDVIYCIYECTINVGNQKHY